MALMSSTSEECPCVSPDKFKSLPSVQRTGTHIACTHTEPTVSKITRGICGHS